MTKKKELGLMLAGLIFLLIAITGITYAAFNYSKTGEKVNTITTGTIQMNYTESSNVISITNALPTTDNTGKKLMNSGEYFDFSVTTTIVGNAMINWEIAAKELAESTFSGDNIKYYLTQRTGTSEVTVLSPTIYSEEQTSNEVTGRPEGMMSLATGTTTKNAIMNYRLRIWVTDTYNPQGDGGKLVYKTSINVYGKTATTLNLVMDLSGNNHQGTIIGATRKTASLSFDGKDDYINCGLANYDFQDQVTMMIKVKFSNINKNQAIFNNIEIAGLGFFLENKKISWKQHIHNEYQETGISQIVEDNRWYTVVGTYDGNKAILYIDGVKVDEQIMTGTITVSNQPIFIGANPQPDENHFAYANIEVESAAIYTKALSESEITTNFKNSIHLTDRDKLLLYYDFTS